jgi:hypothetical protein
MIQMSNTVWLLFNELDYESATVHSVYANKPSKELLATFIQDSFGYAYDKEVATPLANKLFKANTVRFMDLYTWQLEKRVVM